MTEWLLFTDGSVNTQTKSGYGAALWVASDDTKTYGELKDRIKVKKFTETSSTKMELQTLLWALTEIPEGCKPLTVYTDCQNILSLASRRAGFEKQNYHSKRGKPLRGAALYQAFFEVADARGFKLVKIKGHLSVAQRDSTDRLFKLVDQASRKASRKE
jgi:ribonuclease HI